MYSFSKKSKQILSKVHKDLNALANEVLKISPIDFSITEDGKNSTKTTPANPYRKYNQFFKNLSIF